MKKFCLLFKYQIYFVVCRSLYICMCFGLGHKATGSFGLSKFTLTQPLFQTLRRLRVNYSVDIVIQKM